MRRAPAKLEHRYVSRLRIFDLVAILSEVIQEAFSSLVEMPVGRIILNLQIWAESCFSKNSDNEMSAIHPDTLYHGLVVKRCPNPGLCFY